MAIEICMGAESGENISPKAAVDSCRDQQGSGDTRRNQQGSDDVHLDEHDSIFVLPTVGDIESGLQYQEGGYTHPTDFFQFTQSFQEQLQKTWHEKVLSESDDIASETIIIPSMTTTDPLVGTTVPQDPTLEFSVPYDADEDDGKDTNLKVTEAKKRKTSRKKGMKIDCKTKGDRNVSLSARCTAV